MNATMRASVTTGFQPVIGHAISIRALRADDFDIEYRFITGLSLETRNSRLLGGARPVTPEYVARLTRIDFPRELALAAVVMLGGEETLIGVARYALEADGAGCEFALVIADAWQGRGIGRRLTESLTAAAQAHGIARMSGYVLSTNAAMLGLARKLGFRLQRVPGDATLTQVTLELTRPN
ncbi:MAG: GNAT family N-acetyltransferase [Betaproteobacteria bacterium]|nr:GNAT family N-acetyltransferase [Betaproteobacteria bacterium]